MTDLRLIGDRITLSADTIPDVEAINSRAEALPGPNFTIGSNEIRRTDGGGVDQVAVLHRNSTGKVLKREVREPFCTGRSRAI